MGEVVCGQCGHRNPAESNFCSSCGAPLDDGDRPTITFQIDAPAPDDEVQIDLDDVPSGGLLVVRTGPNAGSKFALDKDKITAGRHPDSDIFLDDITVSRRHVEVVRVADGYEAHDVGSLNGTYLNRSRIEEAALTDGDELQIGKFKLVFLAGPAPEG